MGDKTVKEMTEGPVTAADLPYINTVVRKGETVEIRPGTPDRAKIMEVKRKFLKTGRE